MWFIQPQEELHAQRCNVDFQALFIPVFFGMFGGLVRAISVQGKPPNVLELLQSVIQGAFIGIIVEKVLAEQAIHEQYRMVLIMLCSFAGDSVLPYLRKKIQKIIDKNEQ